MNNKEKFIIKANRVHNNFYIYENVDYKNSHTKVEIVCPIHGKFTQRPTNHLRGQGCPICSNNKKLTTETFIQNAKKIHGNKYDYSKVEYVNMHTPVCIICPEHGEFWQKPAEHTIQKSGCLKCKGKRISEIKHKNASERFYTKAFKTHGDYYDYSKVNYINAHTPVCIICPEHGEFWQKPSIHLVDRCGCPVCSESHLEKEIRLILENNNINFISQHTFEWLKYKRNLSLDFYLPDYNVAIECQGSQHYLPNKFLATEDEFNLTQKRDNLKYRLCKENNIDIIYYLNDKLVKYLKENIQYITTPEDLLDRLNNLSEGQTESITIEDMIFSEEESDDMMD